MSLRAGGADDSTIYTPGLHLSLSLSVPGGAFLFATDRVDLATAYCMYFTCPLLLLLLLVVVMWH